MTVSQLAEPLPLNVVTVGTEDIWGPPVNENWVLIRAEVVELLAALALKADTSALTTKADLVNNKVPANQLPSLSISNVHPAASEAAMLALTADPGDIAVRSDVGHLFGLAASPASTLINWVQLDLAGVSSINGSLTGAVTGIATLAANQTFAGTNTFSNPLTVGAATTANHAVRLSQMEDAIAAIPSGGGGSTAPYAVTFGNGTLTSFTHAHGRGTADVMWNVWDISVTPRKAIVPDEVTVTATDIVTSYLEAPTTNQLRLVVR